MKFIAATILTAILAYVSGLFLPWWGIAIAAFIPALLIPQRSWPALFAGFFGIFLLWAGLAWWFDMANEGILSSKVAAILPLGGNSLLLVIVTGVVGGLVGAFAALTGNQLRPARSRRK